MKPQIKHDEKIQTGLPGNRKPVTSAAVGNPNWISNKREQMYVGDRVRVERDETRYPSKGTWPRFRGRTGTIVEINHDHKCPHLTEYGVLFGTARTDGRGGQRDIVTWFKAYEMGAAAAVRNAEPRTPVHAIDPHTGAQLALV